MKQKFFDFDIKTKLGDISESKTEAIIVPEYYAYSERKGVANIVGSKIGNFKSFDDYDEIASKEKLDFADVVITNSYGKDFSKIIHVVTVGVGVPKEEEIALVSGAVYNAIYEGYKNKIRLFSIPLLNTGMGGRLTSADSAKAIIRGMEDAILLTKIRDGKTPKIEIVIYKDEQALEIFNKALNKRISDINKKYSGKFKEIYKDPKEMMLRIRHWVKDPRDINGENFSELLKRQKGGIGLLDEVIVCYVAGKEK